MIRIYHNARCSKSRECLAFMEDSGVDYEVINYLTEVPTFEELKELIRKLGIKPMELVRQNEPLWLEKFQGKKLYGERLIKTLIKYPILIQRPIVVNGNKAIIARPIEAAAAIITNL